MDNKVLDDWASENMKRSYSIRCHKFSDCWLCTLIMNDGIGRYYIRETGNTQEEANKNALDMIESTLVEMTAKSVLLVGEAILSGDQDRIDLCLELYPDTPFPNMNISDSEDEDPDLYDDLDSENEM